MDIILNNVKYLALRILDSENDEIARQMQKILHTNEFYYFYSGIEIKNNSICFNNVVPQELYRIENIDGSKIELNLCAIVGENGSGKSSIVEYIIRILNNLATYVMGENYRSPKAEHLHYIPHVYAELYILIETNIFQIKCQGNHICLESYSFNGEKSKFLKTDTALRFSDYVNYNDIVSEHPDLHNIIRNLCYTVVVNYSLYAFNPDNYIEESTPINKEIRIRNNGKKFDDDVKLYKDIKAEAKETDDDRILVSATSWLQGLFHKNDGYQTPIVLNPFRKNGGINMRTEYNLAKERLLSLVFMYDLKTGERFFNTINRKLLISGFSLRANTYRNQKIRNVYNTLQGYLKGITKNGCEILFQFIKDKVVSEFNIPLQEKIALKDDAWNYIITKIIKITFTYSRYSQIRGTLLSIKDSLSDDDKYNIEKHLSHLWSDHSHITRKLYRTINYLRFNIVGRKRIFIVNDYLKSAQLIINGKMIYPPYCLDELLPPPIFDVDFLLYDINDIKQKKRIPFSTLSSGEKQVTYTLTSFYYHLMNLNSKHDVAVMGRGYKYKNVVPIKNNVTSTNFKFRHVTIIFDEIELYFHPEMQRTFIANLIDGISQLSLKNIRSIQIMLVTHSPFILSDIPKINVLFLKSDGHASTQEDMKTFGANIHHILKNSFFLKDGTMGQFAQKEINKIIQEINFCKYCYQLNFIREKYLTGNNLEFEKRRIKMANYIMLGTLSTELYNEDMDDNSIIQYGMELYDNRYNYWCSMVEIIEEPIIRESLKKQIKEIEKYVDNKD